MRIRFAVAMGALACALVATRASGDPLAVLVPNASGSSRPTAEERAQLADAVASALERTVPDVLSGTETRSRIEVLDPAQLACASPTCAGQIATLLRARGVVLVLPVLAGARLDLTISVINVSGDVRSEQHDATTIGDWQDALALGRLLASRVAVALRPSNLHPASTAPVASGAPVVATPTRRPNLLEVAAGGALVVGGAIAVIVPAVRVAQGDVCVMYCNPSDLPMAQLRESPSALNAVWIAGGGVAVIAGAVLAIHGLHGRTEQPMSSRRTHAPHFSFAVAPGAAQLTLDARF